MGNTSGPIFVLLLSISVFAQADLQPIAEAQRRFERAAFESGARSAFLTFLRDDAVVFRPGPVNGLDHWTSQPDDPSTLFIRNLVYTDIAANGLMGYTTGNWRTYKKGKTEALARFGQYVTIWERSPGGPFRISLDIAVSHDKMPFSLTNRPIRKKQTRDRNERGWSPADASMNFLRMSMTNVRLGGAFEQYAADDVRLLVDDEPPLLGRKRVVTAMNRYVASDFPTKITMFQATDMAYTWNPCKFTNNDEGMEIGNCLNIWKLRDKKWWIVLAVYSKFPNDKPPVIKRRS